MDHVAIMKKSRGLIPKILTREKTIESRWYKNKTAPWGNINSGDIVYFKNAGEGVSAKAEISRVEAFSGLGAKKIRDLLIENSKLIGIKDIEKFYEQIKNKRYGLLIHLKKPEKIESFGINKKGFGTMAAWMCVGDINSVRDNNFAPKSDS